MREKTDILGVKVDDITKEELEENISELRVRTIMYANVNSINIAQKNKEYKEILNSADIVYPDGQGIIWAAGVFGYYFKERITAADFFCQVCKKISEKKVKLYLLGGRPGIAEKVKERLKQDIPLLDVIGMHHGYFDEEEEKRIVDEIKNLKADILTVGMGSPNQEKWIYCNRHRLNVSLCWAVGGLFDFISGKVKRAPRWMLNCHLEWLYRLFCEPKRLWKRYLIGNILFIWRILRFRVSQK